MEERGREPGHVLCLVPPGFDDAALARLQRDLAQHPAGIRAVVERRRAPRRSGSERRRERAIARSGRCRRRILNAGGRRIADRRAEVRVWRDGTLLWRHLERRHGPLQFLQVRPHPHEEVADALRLVVRFQSGDAAAFRALYERYFTKVYRFFRSALADRDAAEDQAQEVFIRVFRGLPTYEIRGVPFEAWLFRIARNQLSGEQRRRHARLVEEPTAIGDRHEGAQDDVSIADRYSDDAALLDLVRRLPLAQRQVIVLRFVLDLDWRTIAVALERSPGAVRQLEQRAFATLRRRLEPAMQSASVERLPLVRRQVTSPVTGARRKALAA